MPGTIEQIFSAPAHGARQLPVGKATLTIDAGLIGDRYEGEAAVISLIEAEAIERFNEVTGLNVTPAAVGRNVVTRGVRLNPLEKATFRLGNAILQGFELCEPCAVLGAKLSTDDVPPVEVVKQFLHSAGIRARVVAGCDIKPGDAVGDLVGEPAEELAEEPKEKHAEA